LKKQREIRKSRQMIPHAYELFQGRGKKRKRGEMIVGAGERLQMGRKFWKEAQMILMTVENTKGRRKCREGRQFV
jgi:hypothetical protein